MAASEGSVAINGNLLSLSKPSSVDARYTKYLYIRGTGPFSPAQKQQLADIEVMLFEYLGKDTYLCRYEPTDLAPVLNLPFIASANVYPRRVKLTQFLSDEIQADRADISTPAKKFDVAILLHKGETQDVDSVLSELSAKAGLERDAITVDHNHIHVSADGDTLTKIVDMDAVRAVQEIIPRKFFNNVARQDMFVPDYSDVSSEVAAEGFTGAGQAVTVADTGFDLGTMTDVHPAFKGPNGESRVIDLIAVGRSNLTNDPRGHGTHVCGSVLGDGISTERGKIQGTAPKAELVMQSLLTQQGDLYPGANLWDTLFDPPYKKHKNARVHTNSWGADFSVAKRQLPYNSTSEDIDRFVWHHPDQVICFAAGNDGRSFSATGAQIGAEAAAKNCITVGATQSSRGAKGYSFDGSPHLSGNRDAIAGFSSRGPTLERRIKPDVVAPGYPVFSAATRDPSVTSDDKSNFGPYNKKDDPLWMFDSGTSMATPLVAGVCAVLRGALASKAKLDRPSAALVKALLINGAVDLGRPQTEQGFGRVNLAQGLLPITHGLGPSEMVCGFADVGMSTGEKLKEWEEWKHVVYTSSLQWVSKIKVTLAYSDRHGMAIQNKLSLKVMAGNEERQFESVVENNVEQIEWNLDNKVLDTVTIIVRADRIARLRDSQAFAVVWRVVY
ncbi:peptidase S8/S53 domain-containing protein [Sordaria brevicollis]|uniref:Peptidase S8/S53 domain-containing protein n=1 Tax=Sordaria brevicollis TaxID=83679 RepID=A0AAE0PDV2_SORBR|nr:peptidase S8/S53 domain-containing protein [Sordaria brevicollis]